MSATIGVSPVEGGSAAPRARARDNAYAIELGAVLSRLRGKVDGGIIEQAESQLANVTAAGAAEWELRLARLLSVAELREHVRVLEQRFVEIGDEPLAPRKADDDESALRAYADELIGRTYRARALLDEFEQIRRRQLWRVLIVGLGFGLVVGGILALHASDDASKEFYVIMLAGAAGGITSCLRRLYAAQPGSNVIAASRALRASALSIAAAPLLGAVFAIVLHLCFVGGLIKGVLFPNLAVDPKGPIEMKQFVQGTVTGEAADLAKLVLWTFLAGFAERFVPDLLDSFVARAKKTAAKATGTES